LHSSNCLSSTDTLTNNAIDSEISTDNVGMETVYSSDRVTS
jgi:hypothetical protein